MPLTDIDDICNLAVIFRLSLKVFLYIPSNGQKLPVAELDIAITTGGLGL